MKCFDTSYKPFSKKGHTIKKINYKADTVVQKYTQKDKEKFFLLINVQRKV
jgi:hypothetical protein